MNNQGSKDDCYFYFYSSCTKGDDCPFRHCQAALGTETVCCLWREGKCFRDNCKFRHMENRINRKTIRCYWEDQPGGCLKPHCVFLHRKPRFNTGNKSLILPVSSTTTQVNPSTRVSEVKDSVKHIAVNPVVESYSNNIVVGELSPTSHPVEPIVVSFDGEESDSESASSTPMKSASDSKYNSSSVKKDLTDNFSEEKDNLGIKTLEQIKMEKIHKESDNFYKSDDIVGAVIPDKSLGVLRNSTFLNDIFSFPAYDAPYIDAAQIKMPDVSYKADCYPPQSDFLLLSERPKEKSVCVNTESSQHPPENENLFKNRLLKRKSLPLYSETSLPPKKMACLKKSKDDPLDFKIKTLEEIRREKQNKSGNNEETSVKNSSQDAAAVDDSHNKDPSVLTSKTESSNINEKSFRRLKINRQPKEPHSNSDIVQEADSSTENQKKESRTQMILHEVQNITEDQNKTEIKGKRKENDISSESKSAKQFKSDSINPCSTTISSTPSDLQNNSIGEEKQMNKRPVLKRRKSTLISTSESEISSTVSKTCDSSVSSPKENNTSPKEDKSLSSSKDSSKKTSKSSVDELDSFLMNEADVSLDYESDGTLNEPEDILLEIEQLLDS